MTSILTISALMQQSGSHFRIYDLGRKITKISKKSFLQIELNQLPYPFPAQGHAAIAVIFWQQKATEPYLWFIKLPLDERGLLNQGARNHFIAIIIEALGLENAKNNLSMLPNKKQAEILKNNPYHFSPAQYKLAALNGIIKTELKQVASQYYQHCQHYLAGKSSWHDWQNIAVQGLSDFAARLNQHKNEQCFVRNINQLPEQVLIPLCGALENQTLPLSIIDAIIEKFHDSTNNSLLQQHLLRALASSCEHPHVTNMIYNLLTDNQPNDDLLIVISSRCWLALPANNLLMMFLEKLVTAKEITLFSAIFKDLIAIPAIRPILFKCMREPNRSQALARAIGQLFNQLGA